MSVQGLHTFGRLKYNQTQQLANRSYQMTIQQEGKGRDHQVLFSLAAFVFMEKKNISVWKSKTSTFMPV